MFHILCHYDVPDNVCQEISVLYCGTKSSVLVRRQLNVRWKSGESPNRCPITRHLGSFSFITVLDWVLCGGTIKNQASEWSRRSQRYPAEKVSNLDFADDIMELEESLEEAQSQLDLLGLTAKEVGLHINTTKTKRITCNIPNTSLQLNGEDIENTEDLQYLGSYIALTGKDIECRKGKGWNEFWKLVRIRFEVSCTTPTTGATF